MRRIIQSQQPPPGETCRRDQDCRTINARCYPGLSAEQLFQEQIPSSDSLHCYCNLLYSWIGPECSQLSQYSILLGVSNLLIGFIALLLATVLIVDIITLKRSLGHEAKRFAGAVHPRLERLPSTKGSGVFPSCNGKHSMDMHMVTSILLFISLVTLVGTMIVDTTRNWMLQTCLGPDGARQNCLLALHGVFTCASATLWISLMLLLSALMYNASFRANGLSTLPCASIWTLLILDIALFITLVLAAALDNIAIASFSGACFVFIGGVINLMTCYRLRDFSCVNLLLECSCGRLHGCMGLKDRPRWTIKQRLMAISMAICFLNFLIMTFLIVRGIFANVHTIRGGQIVIVSDNIFRWAYLGVLIVYFTLIHYNSKERIHVIEKRQSLRLYMSQRTHVGETGAPVRSSQSPASPVEATYDRKHVSEGQVHCEDNHTGIGSPMSSSRSPTSAGVS